MMKNIACVRNRFHFITFGVCNCLQARWLAAGSFRKFFNANQREKNTVVTQKMQASEIKETILQNMGKELNEQGYFVEPAFYHPLTKAKEANLPSDRTNVPNADYLNRTKDGYLSNEQILDIFGKPLDSKDFELSQQEQDALKEDPSQFKAILHLAPSAPCRAHVLNMYLDDCGDESKYLVVLNTKF